MAISHISPIPASGGSSVALSGISIVKTVTVSTAETIQAGSYIEKIVSAPSDSTTTGYTPVGIIGYSVSGNTSASVGIFRIYFNRSENKINVYARNYHTSTAASATITVDLLYISNAQAGTAINEEKTTITGTGIGFEVTKYDRVVCVAAVSGSLSQAVAAGGTVATLPERFRPTATQIFLNSSGQDNAYHFRINISTSGTITINEAQPAGTYLRFSHMYFTAYNAVGSRSGKEIQTYYGEKSVTINGNTDGTLSVSAPSGSTQVLSLVPIGYTPGTSWDTYLIFKSAAVNQIGYRAQGSTSQTYTIRYVMTYV